MKQSQWRCGHHALGEAAQWGMRLLLNGDRVQFYRLKRAMGTDAGSDSDAVSLSNTTELCSDK